MMKIIFTKNDDDEKDFYKSEMMKMIWLISNLGSLIPPTAIFKVKKLSYFRNKRISFVMLL